MEATDFLTAAHAAAKAAGHLFPDWAACEAAHASKFGATECAVKGNNLFDFRVPVKRGVGTLTIPIEHASKLVMRLAFASWQDCFAHRAAWMQQVTMFYLVRRAKTGEEYIHEMNKLASRPDVYEAEVMAIYRANAGVFGYVKLNVVDEFSGSFEVIDEHAGIGG